MPGDVTVWFNPRRSKARVACRDLLEEQGVECSLMDYQETPPSADEIRRVLGLLDTDDPARLPEPANLCTPSSASPTRPTTSS